MPRKTQEDVEGRVDDALRLSGGRVPLRVVFDDAEAVKRAKAHAGRKKDARLLEFMTRVEADRLRAAALAAPAPPTPPQVGPQAEPETPPANPSGKAGARARRARRA